MFQLKRVETKKEWDDFISLPWKIYQGNPQWVPPLKIAVRELLDVNKNPFFKHAYMYPIIAYKDGECVGRIVGVIDDNHNRFHQETSAFFGFFEAIHDQKLVNQLFDEVSKWAKSRGMNRLLGPMNPSTNHECGLLVEGFEHSPMVMMTYNPPYYAEVLEKWGLTKAKDLLGFILTHEKKFNDRILAHAERIKQKGNIVFRPINMRKFKEEAKKIYEVYNDAWEKNWGFVPLEPDEWDHMIKEMKMIVDPHLLLICEINGEVAGFALSLPDVNQAIKKIPDGKLLPFGLFKLLWNTKGPGRRKTIKAVRIITLGIKKRFQELGLGSVFYTETYRIAAERGYVHGGEASWILEDNTAMVKAIKFMNGNLYKRYRIYERTM